MCVHISARTAGGSWANEPDIRSCLNHAEELLTPAAPSAGAARQMRGSLDLRLGGVSTASAVSERGSTPRISRPPTRWALRITVPRCGRSLAGVDLIVILLVILIVLALVGSIAVSPLLWVLVIILVLFAFLGRGRYYGRRG